MLNWLRRHWPYGDDKHHREDIADQYHDADPEVMRARRFLDEMERRVDALRVERDVISRSRDAP